VTESLWLGAGKTPDCAFISDHFDNSLKYIAEAHRTAVSSDLGYLTELIATRAALNYVRNARLNCAPSGEELLALDDCYAIGDVVDNAPYGFANFRGIAVTPGQSDSDLWSLYYLPGVDRCVVTSSSNFYCTWPELEESDTAARSKALVDKLLACNNFVGMKKTVTTRDNKSRTSQITSLSSEKRATIRITNSYWKTTDGSSGDWGVSLEVNRP
jgi:hypothetical protein